jgi:hypothetical protein
VAYKGPQGKPIKQFINSTLIYPPKADQAEVFFGADPTVSGVDIARRLQPSVVENLKA